MDNEDDEPAVAADEAARHRPLDDDLRALIGSGLALARAEANLQTARLGYAAGKLKWIGLLGLFAVLLAFFALVALTVGLVIALTPSLGAIGAMFCVFGGLAVGALICAAIAAGQWRRMVKMLSNRKADHG